jgi:hypothetical protein
MKRYLKYFLFFALLLTASLSLKYSDDGADGESVFISEKGVSDGDKPEPVSPGEYYVISNYNSLYKAVENSYSSRTLTNISRIPAKSTCDRVISTLASFFTINNDNSNEYFSGKAISPDPHYSYLLLKNLRI